VGEGSVSDGHELIWALDQTPDAAKPAPAVRDIVLEVTARFTELRESVYRYVAYAIRNPAEAEEITQETFLRLYRALDGGHRIESIPRWVFSIAHHLSIDRTRRRERLYVKPVLEPAGWRLLEESVPDEAPSSEELLMETSRAERLNAALATLSPVQRQCFQLRLEGLRYREIAEVLGMSITGVADAVQRAVKKLKDVVAD
jgi:RNA polymerase sigma-70 factor (ECF subfamily)